MCISVLDRLERSRSLLSLSRGRRRSVRRRRRFRAVLEINFRNGAGIFWPMASLSNAAKIAADIACALRLALFQNLLCHPEISFESRSSCVFIMEWHGEDQGAKISCRMLELSVPVAFAGFHQFLCCDLE